MNKNLRICFDVAWYIIVFFCVQLACGLLLSGVKVILGNATINSIAGFDDYSLIAATILSNVIAIVLFYKLKWTPMSRAYIKSRPWGVLLWAVFFSLGSILPLEWISEMLNVQLSSDYAELFERILGKPLGYLAVGILAPIAEEMLFRGAVLRKLLGLFGEKKHWIAIFISALLFGLVHGNIAQGFNAVLLGMMLGWLYYRTGSIIPGIALHWTNNTVAYVMFNLMPSMNDGKLIDLFHGDNRLMMMGIGCSLLILLPSLLQLYLRAKKA